MRIERLSLISGAKEARGLTVVIDVFRACTTAAYVMANGAERIVPVGSLEEAFETRRRHPGWVLMGERDGERVEGFDYDNSPFEIGDVDFEGKTVIFTTAAGTQGIVNAAQADEVLLGSFVTAGAIVRYVRKVQPEVLSLVAMGDSSVKPNVEDELFAEYVDETLRGRSPDFEEMRRRIRASPSGSKFFDQTLPQYHEEDFHMALDLDRFDFILKVQMADGLRAVKRQNDLSKDRI
jgi:2-phosphosulfolactate phosphatase